MSRILFLSFALSLPLLGGCAWHDVLFSAFGDYHSDGYTQAERQANYREQVEAMKYPAPH